MPSADKNLILTDWFISLETAGTNREKSELLGKAKNYILNQMSSDEIVGFFTRENQKNFEFLFNLDIWTASLDAANSIVNYLEPYDIMQRIFVAFESLSDFIDVFGEQIRFLLSQNKDENVKHLCVKHFTYLALHIDFSKEENQVAAKDSLELKIKQILSAFVSQIPHCTVTYTHLLTDLFCKLIVKLEHIHRRLHEDIFSCSIFENNPELIAEFDRVSNTSSIQYFRVLEFIIHIACLSNDCLVSIAQLRFNLSERLNKYLKHSNDTLAQLNCIELIANLLKTNHGYDFAEKNNYLSFMLHQLEQASDASPIASIMVPPIVKLFSLVARERPTDIFNSYSNYYEFIFKLTQLDFYLMNNLENLHLGIETFTYLFESNIVKQFLLQNYEPQLYALMERLVELVNRCINTKLKANALICLAEVLSSDPSLLQTSDTDLKWSKSAWVTDKWIQMCQELYKKLTMKVSHEALFKMCAELARQPFEETRLAAQCYLKALAQTKWGVVQLFTPNGFNRPDEFLDGYLLNREVEKEKRGLESKCELVKLLVANFSVHAELVELVGETYLEKMKTYVREGPFYSRAEYKVAFESN